MTIGVLQIILEMRSATNRLCILYFQNLVVARE